MIDYIDYFLMYFIFKYPWTLIVYVWIGGYI